MHDLAPQILMLLFLAAILAGFIDSIAGGGGLITIPAMLLAGIPPLESLATNKVQGPFGAASATIAYARRGHVDLKAQLPMAAIAFVGGGIGALIASHVPGHYLGAAIPFLLIGIALFFALKPNLSDVDRAQRMTPALFSVIAVPLVALYDGVFGPGAGSFYMLSFVLLAGFGMLKATAHTKLLNLGSNLGSLAVFAVNGVIFWKLGLMMGVGQLIGAQIGSRLAMHGGAKIIKPLLVLSCIAMAAKLLSDPAHPIRLWLGI
ncbi:TSUP family transporter [Rhizobium sp. SSA_523]|uniref:TSUP family transporter n=1 Tax=Rhizobium sp. SSA_523 TaxID=2952477 RepID=UPI002091AB51|nr:TSUP family transporter [Rhizobium sp. SSA_523]MCO5730197.1 TSUP family transporter [Rhizobium sp. SSA_523]WKC25258.1 TSUP family transporter [Rhizobium sp. SSA_523]